MANLFQRERQRVIDACRRLADTGYWVGTGGSLALRLDSKHLAATPSGTDYYLLQPADIAVLRVADLKQVSGTLPPSVESAMHAVMLEFWPQMEASIHTDQPIASAAAILDRSIPISDASHIAALGREVAITGYGPSGTIFLRHALRKKLRSDIHAYLLRGHGVICISPTLGEAEGRLALIEAVAARFLRQGISDHNAKPTALSRVALQVLMLHDQGLPVAPHGSDNRAGVSPDERAIEPLKPIRPGRSG
jgi:L-fuculose-phosphate aldolase